MSSVSVRCGMFVPVAMVNACARVCSDMNPDGRMLLVADVVRTCCWNSVLLVSIWACA